MNTIIVSAIQQIRNIVRAILHRPTITLHSELFYNSYLEMKSYYLNRFGKAPSVLLINTINSGKLNIETNIDAPVTLAELLNPASTNYEPGKTQVIGFRSVLATN